MRIFIELLQFVKCVFFCATYKNVISFRFFLILYIDSCIHLIFCKFVNAYIYVEYAEYYDYSSSYPEGEDGESSQENIQSLVLEDLMAFCKQLKWVP